MKWINCDCRRAAFYFEYRAGSNDPPKAALGCFFRTGEKKRPFKSIFVVKLLFKRVLLNMRLYTLWALNNHSSRMQTDYAPRACRASQSVVNRRFINIFSDSVRAVSRHNRRVRPSDSGKTYYYCYYNIIITGVRERMTSPLVRYEQLPISALIGRNGKK